MVGFFFFQAEDGIRDSSVTGVQTCALPISRMPVVRRLATTMFGRFPAIDFNPDEVVALGAAVQAGLKAKDAALREVVMTDVCPYSLGVAVSKRMPDGSTIQGHFDPVIERNTTVPVSRVNNYVPTSQIGRAHV